MYMYIRREWEFSFKLVLHKMGQGFTVDRYNSKVFMKIHQYINLNPLHISFFVKHLILWTNSTTKFLKIGIQKKWWNHRMYALTYDLTLVNDLELTLCPCWWPHTRRRCLWMSGIGGPCIACSSVCWWRPSSSSSVPPHWTHSSSSHWRTSMKSVPAHLQFTHNQLLTITSICWELFFPFF